MRDFGGAYSRAVFGLVVGMAMAVTGAWAQEGEATAPAEPVVIEIIGDAADADTGGDSTAPAADIREKNPERPASGDPGNLTPVAEQPLAATASTGGSEKLR